MAFNDAMVNLLPKVQKGIVAAEHVEIVLPDLLADAPLQSAAAREDHVHAGKDVAGRGRSQHELEVPVENLAVVRTVKHHIHADSGVWRDAYARGHSVFLRVPGLEVEHQVGVGFPRHWFSPSSLNSVREFEQPSGRAPAAQSLSKYSPPIAEHSSNGADYCRCSKFLADIYAGSRPRRRKHTLA
jgi:hypothetical protein